MNNLSQEAFANICDLNRTYISDVERGSRNVTLTSLLKLARGLHTSVSQLTADMEEKASPPYSVKEGKDVCLQA